MKRGLAVAVVAVALLMAVPLTAHAANDYGLTYVGSEKCLSCHGSMTGRWQVGVYGTTPHALNVRSVDELGGVAGLEPSSNNYWPSPIFGSGTFRFGKADVLYQMGSPWASQRRYISKFKNDGPHTLSTGDTLPNATGPADDLLYFDARFYPGDNYWRSSAITGRVFLQSCGPCHFTGVTRPSNATYPLPNGGEMSASTESSMAAHGIQCETCHASSEAGDHWGSGVGVTRTTNALRSQTCGQCHSRFTSNQRNSSNGSLSNPNGFTPNQALADFGSVYGAQYARLSLFAPAPSIPATETRFYPTGHYSSGGHLYPFYNEWLLSGHSHSLRNINGDLFIPFLRDSCLPCHSGEAFLQSIGYGATGPNDVGLHDSSIANDRLNIECGVCHTVHSPSGTAQGLRLEGDGLCVKCHVEGVAEIRGGRGLVGVGNTGEWMPDAKCYECHMPRTTGEKRSHRLLIMMPGDAEEWDVPATGDSCTPCHAGQTRAKLQGSIDAWQAEIKGSHTKATTALNSAKTRTAAKTTSGKRLISAAEHNLKLINGERSWGVHNLPYSRAGVERADYYARSVGARYSLIRATGYSKTAKRAVVFGTLRFGTGAAAGGQRVRIESRLRGSKTWKRIATVTTDSSGRFSHATLPKRGTTTMYRVRWSPKSDVTVTSGAVKVRR